MTAVTHDIVIYVAVVAARNSRRTPREVLKVPAGMCRVSLNKLGVVGALVSGCSVAALAHHDGVDLSSRCRAHPFFAWPRWAQYPHASWFFLLLRACERLARVRCSPGRPAESFACLWRASPRVLRSCRGCARV